MSQTVSPWRPQHLGADPGPVDPDPIAESLEGQASSDSDGLVALASELERVRQEGYEQGLAEARALAEQNAEAHRQAEERSFAQLLRELGEIRARFDAELEATLHALLAAVNRVVFTRSWKIDDALLGDCVHAALEVFDDLHPPLAVHVSAADAPRVERILADAALATPVRVEPEFEAGRIEVSGAQRSAELDLMARLDAALTRLAELRS